jgi:hypothetical protein
MARCPGAFNEETQERLREEFKDGGAMPLSDQSRTQKTLALVHT